MIPASAEYLAYEALKTGATPAIRIAILPYLWPSGVNDDGSFVHCFFVAPDRIQADDQPFTGGYWESPVVAANLQLETVPAVVTWDYNSPGFNSVLSWRGADTEAGVAGEAYTALSQGETINIPLFYQFKLTIEGFRAWAYDGASPDEFTAYATDTPGGTNQGYASDIHHSKDRDTYIQELNLLGEFPIVRDIEQAGTVTMEAPNDFDELVAGDHSGLLLNNRQKDDAGLPAPLYSPNKDSFILAGQGWGDKKLKLSLGWNKGGFLRHGWFSSPMFKEDFTEFLPLFLGNITKWGPVSRSVDQDGAVQPNSVEVYAKDFIAECLLKRIALPASDGSPAPLTFGEFLCKADSISGWSPAPIQRSAYFEQDNYNELDHVMAINGGAFSLITPGITGTRAFRATVNGANQSAYGAITLPFTGEIFVTGTMRFTLAPTIPKNLNMTFMQAIDSTGAADFAISIDSTGAMYSSLGDKSSFNIMAYLGAPITFALWFSPANPGYAKLWINGDDVLSYKGDLSGTHPIEFRFGADVILSEAWTIDFDDIEVRRKYYDNAFQVFGGPFESIGPVYLENIAQPDSQTVDTFIQTLTRYPAYGMVQFKSTDPDFRPGNDVLMRVVEYAGGRHPLQVIESLLSMAGLTGYIDVGALMAAYAAVPDDICHARFEGGEKAKLGLNDISSMGITVADCLKEILSRFMYWMFVDAGKIKITPYTGIPPDNPVMALGASELYEAGQTIDLESINAFVSAKYGWYSRNPSLFYVAGIQEAGGQGVGLDYSWESPVACESRDVVKSKVDLLLKFSDAQERLDPVSLNLSGTRLELMEPVSVFDALLHESPRNYWVIYKEIGFDQGSRMTILKLIRFLGE